MKDTVVIIFAAIWALLVIVAAVATFALPVVLIYYLVTH